MAKTGRIKVRGGLCAGMVLVLTMTVTVYYVQAIELGGFDVDMGTGSFEGDASDWKQDAEEEMPAGDENYVSGDGSWSNSDSSWTTGETSEAGNDAQPETGGEDFFSSGQYETEASGASYNEETSEENEISDRQAENGSVNKHTDSGLEISESQFSDLEKLQSIAPTPTAMETATPSPFPVRELSPVPSPIRTQDILKVPEKEEELPEEECRQKMQILYCRKNLAKASKIKIHPNPELAVAILSIRINGKEILWNMSGGNILLDLQEETEHTEIVTAVMCRRELSWTEAKKNAILTYNIF
ncbi:hypothetical protein [Blautia sp.]|uniref:hypothetical protein n=1 Tax=Blautia sp. TaxID=1955243 RepID=UPI003AB50355